MQTTQAFRRLMRCSVQRCFWLAAATLMMMTVALSVACGSNLPPGGSAVQGPPMSEGNAPQDDASVRRAAARQVLADRLSVAPDRLEFVSEQAVQWADASLGCPEADKMYAQVIVPGYRIIFRHAGNQYEVHTAEHTGSASPYRPVSCEGGSSY